MQINRLLSNNVKGTTSYLGQAGLQKPAFSMRAYKASTVSLVHQHRLCLCLQLQHSVKAVILIISSLFIQLFLLFCSSIFSWMTEETTSTCCHISCFPSVVLPKLWLRGEMRLMMQIQRDGDRINEGLFVFVLLQWRLNDFHRYEEQTVNINTLLRQCQPSACTITYIPEE